MRLAEVKEEKEEEEGDVLSTQLRISRKIVSIPL